VYVEPGHIGASLIAQSSLDKFVLIDWCGEGVPESRKGLFRGSKTSLNVSDHKLTLQTLNRPRSRASSSEAPTSSSKLART
jgi:hypothetical protein